MLKTVRMIDPADQSWADRRVQSLTDFTPEFLSYLYFGPMAEITSFRVRSTMEQFPAQLIVDNSYLHSEKLKAILTGYAVLLGTEFYRFYSTCIW